MKKLLTLLALGLTMTFGVAHAADAGADCAAKAAEKKLAGAAKASFEKKCLADAGGAAASTSPACEKSAADKKLAGAAKASHIKKCMADEKAGPAAAPSCETVAAGKKLAGAAKTSFLKKCEKDATATCELASKEKSNSVVFACKTPAVSAEQFRQRASLDDFSEAVRQQLKAEFARLAWLIQSTG